LTQSVVGTFAPYPKIRARGQMTQLETFANWEGANTPVRPYTLPMGKVSRPPPPMGEVSWTQSRDSAQP